MRREVLAALQATTDTRSMKQVLSMMNADDIHSLFEMLALTDKETFIRWEGVYKSLYN